MGKPENKLQAACLEYLHLRGVMAWRNNTGAVHGSYTSKRTGVTKHRFFRYGHPGSGDIFALVPPLGRFMSVETKVTTEPSDDQIAWMEEVRANGGVAIVARTVDDVHDALEQMRCT